MPTNKPHRRGLLAGLAIIVLAAGGMAAWLSYRATYHFAAVQPGVLYRSGNNSLRRLTYAIDKGHIRTIVALIDDREFADPKTPQFAQEKAWADGHGVRYVRIPVRLGGWPASGQVQQFLQITADPSNQPVLVHCAQGVRRTGMFVAAFEESQLGWTTAHTKSAINPWGHGQGTVLNIDSFIDHYDAQKRTLPSSGLGKGAKD